MKKQTGSSGSLRLFLWVIFLGLAALFSCTSESQEGKETQKADKKPNIIVILADDMGYSDIGCFGSEIATPTLDQLASNGMRFRQFYNAARCCPTRASLLTGLYPHQAGMGRMVTHNSDAPKGPYQGYLNQQCITLAEALNPAGYRTYMSGKWHVGEDSTHWPTKRGFDQYFGLISGASSYYEIIQNQPRTRMIAYNGHSWTPPNDGFYMTDAISDTAVSFLNVHQENHPEKPFLLYLAYTAPHWPLHAPEEEIAKYAERYVEGWDKLRDERFQRMREMGLLDDRYVKNERPEAVPAWEKVEDKETWSRKMAVYAAMIDRMDQGIGKVVAQLEASGELDNTLILFLSDNGGCHENISGRKLNDPNVPIGACGSYVAYREPWAYASNTPFKKYKSWTHEGGIATPFIAHWPKGIQQKNTISDHIGHVSDIMATCLNIAGASYPEQIEGNTLIPLPGKSLLPALKGEVADTARTLFWEHIRSKGIRDGNWKMSAPRGTGEWELYNMAKDPSESNNLAEQMPGKVEELDKKYETWAAQVGVYQLPD